MTIPPSTSLVPAVLALADFFIKNFPGSFQWYPYWYLGNPLNFLIGPVVPVTILLFNKIFIFPSDVTYIFMIGIAWLVTVGGVYYLVLRLGGRRRERWLSALIFLILPFYFLLLTYQNGLHQIAFAFLPWTLVLFKSFLEDLDKKRAFFLSVIIAFELLIDVSILLPLLISLSSLTVVIKPEKRVIGQIIVKTLVILLLSISLSTFWYQPDFWWTLLRNPSIGGMRLSSLIKYVFELLINLIPIVLAVVMVKWRKKSWSKLLLFGVVFFSSYLFLTVFRFLSDPDFILDWIGFLAELQLGLCLILGSLLTKMELRKFYLTAVAIVLVTAIGGWFWTVREWSKAAEKLSYQARVVSILRSNVVDKDRVFLSGSDVFWINQYANITQVRGGMDSYSYHPFWADAAYQIREGTKGSLTVGMMKALGTKFVLVNDNSSEEVFHDFKNPNKFYELNLVIQSLGDSLFKLNDANIGRVATESILEITSPKNGADQKTITKYISTFIAPLPLSFGKPNQITFEGDFKSHEVASLAVTYHPGWKIIKGEGEIRQDSLGNMVIVPKNPGENQFILYFNNFSPVLPGILTAILILVMIKFDIFYKFVQKISSGISLGLGEEDE